MNAHRVVSKAVCRHGRAALRQLSTTPAARSTAFQSYPLPTQTTFHPPRNSDIPDSSITRPTPPSLESQPLKTNSQPPAPAAPHAKEITEQEAQQARPVKRRPLRARKAAMRLTPAAVEQLRLLVEEPEAKLVRVGVRNRGCSGLAYNLEYVDKPGSLDEEVEQDGVRVLIDSKALFSIIGSEMDWVEDKLSQRFVFRNPNISELGWVVG